MIARYLRFTYTKSKEIQPFWNLLWLLSNVFVALFTWKWWWLFMFIVCFQYAKCCYTPFIFLDLETDWVMRRRKSFLEVFSTRFLQNCNTILWIWWFHLQAICNRRTWLQYALQLCRDYYRQWVLQLFKRRIFGRKLFHLSSTFDPYHK